MIDAFRAYCFRALEQGLLERQQVERLRARLLALPAGPTREREMLRVIEVRAHAKKRLTLKSLLIEASSVMSRR